MTSGEWDKDQLRAEVENHEDITVVVDDRSKNINSKPSDHECDTKFAGLWQHEELQTIEISGEWQLVHESGKRSGRKGGKGDDGRWRQGKNQGSRKCVFGCLAEPRSKLN